MLSDVKGPVENEHGSVPKGTKHRNGPRYTP